MEAVDEQDLEMRVRSFGVILDQCLLLEPDREELLVVYDESFFPFFESLLRAVEERCVRASFFYLPKSYQHALIKMADSRSGGVRLPAGLRESTLHSETILNVLDGDLETKDVRSAVIGLDRGSNCRLAHVPGLGGEILEIMLASNIQEILRSCEVFAWALGEARVGELITRDPTGREHILRMDLGGWDNEPMMSPGVFVHGSWGNIPPGETFCCPEPPRVDGSISINGSFHKHVMSEGEDVVLQFREGRLVSWDGTRSPASAAFFEGERRWAKENEDENWCVFAELGIGLNAAIRTLSGNSLFDEKAWGTVHIAIGDNSGFGHTVRSKKHSDLVTRVPTLRLDGRAAIISGVPQIDALTREREERVWAGEELNSCGLILLRGDQCRKEDGVLKRQLNRKGRIGYVAMTSPAVGAALAQLADELRGPAVLVADFVQDHPEFDGFPTMKLLSLLKHYGVLALVC